MKSILILLGALASDPSSDETQERLKILAEAINSQDKSPGQFISFSRADVEWRSIVMDFNTVAEFTPEARAEFYAINHENMALCDNDMAAWFIANRISVHFRLTTPSGDSMVNTFLASDCSKNRSPSSPSSDSQLQPFSFKGLIAGREIDQAYLRDCSEDKDRGELSCRAIDGDIGNYRDLAPYVGIYQNRLTSLTYVFRRGAAQSIYASFMERYGKPCNRADIPWRNPAGAVLQNQTVTWCFSTGKLTLRSISSDARFGDVIYIDEHQAPTKARAKNF